MESPVGQLGREHRPAAVGMKGLPNCPYCPEDQTLEVVRHVTFQIRACECSCCSRRCYVNLKGEIVPEPDGRDVNGIMMHDGD